MALLEIGLLGPPQITLAGEPVEVDTRKAIAMLAYLAVTGQPQRRDSLAAFLWPESGQTRARAALRRTLSSLNKTVNSYGLLEISRESIGLLPDADYWLDLTEFQRAIASARDSETPNAGQLGAIVDLYRGDFMAGFGLRDSPAFDDWQYFQAEQLRRDLSWALEQLAWVRRGNGDFAGAIQVAREWLVLDQLQEPAHQLLMQLYAESGDQAAAIRQYRECVRILNDELGVLPLEVTTELYESILDHQVVPPTPVAMREPEKPESELAAPGIPLIGRETERQRLVGAYRAVDDAGRLLLIEGEAGVGKTRLAGDVLARLREAGVMTVRCRSFAGEQHFAYGTLIDGLRDVIEELDEGAVDQLPQAVRSALSRLLPEIGANLPASVPDLDSPGALRHFYDCLLRFLLSLQRDGQPPVLFVDDLQWSDHATREFLRFLVSRLSRILLCLFVTWRDEDVPPVHDLRQLVAVAAREGIVESVHLGPLSSADVSALALSVRPDLGEASGQWLHELSEGNPFFAIEYLAVLPPGATALDVSGVEPPAGIRDLYHSRLARISETGRQMASAAAVIGRSFDVDLLRFVSGRSEDETVGTVEELLGNRLIQEPSVADSPSVVYDFSHEHLRDFVYHETSLARRRLLHRRAAGTLARRQDAPATQIATHYLLAGDDEQAAIFFARAGDEARALYANTEAEHFYRTALETGHPDSAGLYEHLGDVLTLSGQYAEALNCYQQAAAHASPAQLPYLEHKLGLLNQRTGSWERAASHFQAALAAIIESNPDLQARIIADLSLTAFRQGDVEGALGYGSQALEDAQRAGEDRTLAQIHNLLGVLARNQQNPETALTQLITSLEYAQRLEDPGVQAASLNNLALCLADQGQPDQAIDLARQALDLCRTVGDRHREAALENNLADFYHQLGDEQQSMQHLKYAVEIFAEVGDQTDALQPEIWKLIEW